MGSGRGKTKIQGRVVRSYVTNTLRPQTRMRVDGERSPHCWKDTVTWLGLLGLGSQASYSTLPLQSSCGLGPGKLGDWWRM